MWYTAVLHPKQNQSKRGGINMQVGTLVKIHSFQSNPSLTNLFFEVVPFKFLAPIRVQPTVEAMGTW